MDSIDGSGGVLARAGYCQRRASDKTPIVSRVTFDKNDIIRLSDGYLERIMLHELAHALGLLKSHWELFSLVDTGPQRMPSPCP